MITLRHKRDCTGCSACVARCPVQCISFSEDGDGFLYPVFDVERCTQCGACERVCPVINPGAEREPLAVYAAKNPDEGIREGSSSGGVFTMLSEKVISEGGVVFGARFDGNWEVVHDFTETLEGLAPFRGSKYVQSRMGDNFARARGFLREGRQVLFSGTPCQIAGLKGFLGRDYDNLLSVDIICHGVPSPAVWRRYLSGLGGQVEGVCFRDKRRGWKNYSVVVRGTGRRVLADDPFHENPFMRGFLADLYLRPSCHYCPSKHLRSGSDLTLADYWGIGRQMPDFDDDRGVSLVMVNSPAGEKALSRIAPVMKPADYPEALARNSSWKTSARRSPAAIRKFASEFAKGTPLAQAVHKARNAPLDKKIKKMVKLIIGRK